jgi:formylglycine-generating enzyme required for sulfatase activity
MIWQPQQLLHNGQYRIEAELGRGGYGITYRAWHRKLDCPIVIKSPHVHLRQDPGYGNYVDRFRREGQHLASLAQAQHPNIVRVLDFFDEGENPCLVMAFIEGQTLYDRIQLAGALPESVIVSWIVTMAAALQQVHDLGLVHRDANPANVIIQPDDKPMLIDFGIALEIQPRRTTTMAAFGGHGDFAPFEQLMKKEGARSPKVDIYCLAATLYYAITGELPAGSCDRKIAILEGGDCLISPQAIQPGISDRIQHAILAGMEMDPDDRPESMQAWITLLTTDDGLLSKIGEPTIESLPLQKLEFQTIELNDRGKVIAQPCKTARCFDEILDERGLLLRMIVLPGGFFMMGSPKDEFNSYDDEKPQHLVTVPSFAIGQLTVTQAQWAAIANLPKVKRKLNPSPAQFDGADRPVERVNWEEAIEFCDRLTRLTRKPYRLPTEAEWEYACRAGTTTPFHFGQTITTDFANYRGVDEDRGDRGVLLGNYNKGPKGKFRGATIAAECSPNPFGLQNMHGNVWEWCLDQWHSGYENAPIDGSAWLDENVDANSDRVVRGGSWSKSPQNCRSAIRFFLAPGFRGYNLGFRVLCRVRPQGS